MKCHIFSVGEEVVVRLPSIFGKFQTTDARTMALIVICNTRRRRRCIKFSSKRNLLLLPDSRTLPNFDLAGQEPTPHCGREQLRKTFVGALYTKASQQTDCGQNYQHNASGSSDRILQT